MSSEDANDNRDQERRRISATRLTFRPARNGSPNIHRMRIRLQIGVRFRHSEQPEQALVRVSLPLTPFLLMMASASPDESDLMAFLEGGGNRGPPPASEETISRICSHVKTFDGTSACSICLENVTEGCELDCHHSLHKECAE